MSSRPLDLATLLAAKAKQMFAGTSPGDVFDIVHWCLGDAAAELVPAARVDELLAANNAETERRRQAERDRSTIRDELTASALRERKLLDLLRRAAPGLEALHERDFARLQTISDEHDKLDLSLDLAKLGDLRREILAVVEWKAAKCR